MNIDLNQAAKILEKSEDEVMYLVQTEYITPKIDEESMSWIFDLEDILRIKEE